MIQLSSHFFIALAFMAFFIAFFMAGAGAAAAFMAFFIAAMMRYQDIMDGPHANKTAFMVFFIE